MNEYIFTYLLFAEKMPQESDSKLLIFSLTITRCKTVKVLISVNLKSHKNEECFHSMIEIQAETSNKK